MIDVCIKFVAITIIMQILLWLFTETFEPELCGLTSFLSAQEPDPEHPHSAIVEAGPRLAFASAWSSNAVSICEACGISCVKRIEKSRRYLVNSLTPLTESDLSVFSGMVTLFLTYSWWQ